MEKQHPSPLVPLVFSTLAVVGLLLAVLSFIIPEPSFFGGNVSRAIGFCFFFFGFGEYLNHPLQESRVHEGSSTEESPVVRTRRRNPCELGNILDVLAIISFFAALTFLFFPYQQ